MADDFKDLVAFHGTRAAAALAKGQQVRLLVGASHWTSDGDYKEHLIREAVRSVVPSSLNVSSGFLALPDKKSAELKVSKQCDVLIYDDSERSPIFADGGFAIALAPTVVAVVEVKSTLRNQIGEALDNVASAFKLHREERHSTQPGLALGTVGFSDYRDDGVLRKALSSAAAATIAKKVRERYLSLLTDPVPTTVGELHDFVGSHSPNYPGVICSLTNPPWLAHYAVHSVMGAERRLSLPVLLFRDIAVADKGSTLSNHSLHVLMASIAGECSRYFSMTGRSKHGSIHLSRLSFGVDWRSEYESSIPAFSLLPGTPELIAAFPDVTFLD